MDIALYEFNALNEFEKGEALWEYGDASIRTL